MLPDPRNSPDSGCQSIWQRVERCGKLLGLSLCALGASWSRKIYAILKKSWHPKVSSAGLRLICRHLGSAARPDPIAKYKLTTNWTCCLQFLHATADYSPLAPMWGVLRSSLHCTALSLSLSLSLSLAHSSQIRQDTQYNRWQRVRPRVGQGVLRDKHDTEKPTKPNLIRVQRTLRTEGDSLVYVSIHHAGKGWWSILMYWKVPVIQSNTLTTKSARAARCTTRNNRDWPGIFSRVLPKNVSRYQRAHPAP